MGELTASFPTAVDVAIGGGVGVLTAKTRLAGVGSGTGSTAGAGISDETGTGCGAGHSAAEIQVARPRLLRGCSGQRVGIEAVRLDDSENPSPGGKHQDQHKRKL